ncbi:MAG: hypothetical protein ACLT33_01175 [Lachnospira pectinoschiza]
MIVTVTPDDFVECLTAWNSGKLKGPVKEVLERYPQLFADFKENVNNIWHNICISVTFNIRNVLPEYIEAL